MEYLFGLLLPTVGTALGACAVLFPASFCSSRGKRDLLLSAAFALFAGMMISSAYFGLLSPALSLGAHPLLPLFGFALGFLLLRVLNVILPERKEDRKESASRSGKTDRGSVLFLFLAAVLHNLPEGMAVGSALAGISAGLSPESAFSAVLGIALQNIPDGAMVSVPLLLAGKKQGRALFLGLLSGFAEPIAGALAILFFGAATWTLPLLLSFSAAVMIDVAVEELLPKADPARGSSMLSFALGFLLMMLTDLFL